MDIAAAQSLPWLDAVRERLSDAQRAHRLPHALLVLSVPGLGAEFLAHWIAALVLCDSADLNPCGRCAACRLLEADTHPDYHAVRLEDDARQIKIEQIRGLIDALRLSAYRGGFKVGVIEGGESLNTNGANALLKTLEEPTDDTILVLVAHPAHRLPATIASRCLRLPLKPPAREAALAWLAAHPVDAVRPGNEATRASSDPASVSSGSWDAALTLAGGAPLAARALSSESIAELDRDMRLSLKSLQADATDVTLMAEQWLKSAPGLRLAWLENWITQRVRSALETLENASNEERVRLSGALLKAKIQGLFKLLDSARETRRLAATSMNQQLALESLLLDVNGTLAIAKSQ